MQRRQQAQGPSSRASSARECHLGMLRNSREGRSFQPPVQGGPKAGKGGQIGCFDPFARVKSRSLLPPSETRPTPLPSEPAPHGDRGICPLESGGCAPLPAPSSKVGKGGPGGRIQGARVRPTGRRRRGGPRSPPAAASPTDPAPPAPARPAPSGPSGPGRAGTAGGRAGRQAGRRAGGFKVVSLAQGRVRGRARAGGGAWQ
jgi:hypothetical protein